MKFTIFLISGIVLFSSCQKKVTCANSMELTANTLTPTIGDNVTITATRESDNEIYQWNGPKLNQITGFNSISLDNLNFPSVVCTGVTRGTVIVIHLCLILYLLTLS